VTAIANTADLRLIEPPAHQLQPGDLIASSGTWATILTVDLENTDTVSIVTLTVATLAPPTRTSTIETLAKNTMPALRAATVPVGARVSTRYGIGTVVAPDAVAVEFDVPVPHLTVKVALMPAGNVTLIDNGSAR
jgi:hypothetical protein